MIWNSRESSKGTLEVRMIEWELENFLCSKDGLMAPLPVKFNNFPHILLCRSALISNQ